MGGGPGRMCCEGSSVVVDSDNNNCGDCGIKCDLDNGFTCIQGVCMCAQRALTDCDGECVDLRSDAKNCGECGAVCDQSVWPGYHDARCEAGECTHSPLMICGTSVVDVESNNEHCGECDHPCDADNGFACTGGTCQCWGGNTDCGGSCKATMTDPVNCGGCGITCVSGSCSGGQCEGDAGVIYPDASPDAGMDLHVPD